MPNLVNEVTGRGGGKKDGGWNRISYRTVLYDVLKGGCSCSTTIIKLCNITTRLENIHKSSRNTVALPTYDSASHIQGCQIFAAS